MSNEKDSTSMFKNEPSLKKGFSVDSKNPLFGYIEEHEGSSLKSDSSFEYSEHGKEIKDEDFKLWESLRSIESDDDHKRSNICFF